MTGEVHRWLGTAVLLVSLIVGIWAALNARRAGTAGGALTGGVVATLALLGLQVLLGLDLWARGGRPAQGALAWVHLAGPLVALLAGIGLLLGRRRERAGSYAIATGLTFVAALVSYGIGEMG